MRRWLLLPLLGAALVACGGTSMTPDEVSARLAADGSSIPVPHPVPLTSVIPTTGPIGGEPSELSTSAPKGKKYGRSTGEPFIHPASVKGSALVVRYGYGSCESPWVKVVETSASVTITIQVAEIRLKLGEVCTADLHYGVSLVRLNAPLGTRKLIDGGCRTGAADIDHVCKDPTIS